MSSEMAEGGYDPSLEGHLTLLAKYNCWASYKLINTISSVVPNSDFNCNILKMEGQSLRNILYDCHVEQVKLVCSIKRCPVPDLSDFTNLSTCPRESLVQHFSSHMRMWPDLVPLINQDQANFIDVGSTAKFNLSHLFNQAAFHRGLMCAALCELAVLPPDVSMRAFLPTEIDISVQSKFVALLDIDFVIDQSFGAVAVKVLPTSDTHTSKLTVRGPKEDVERSKTLLLKNVERFVASYQEARVFCDKRFHKIVVEVPGKSSPWSDIADVVIEYPCIHQSHESIMDADANEIAVRGCASSVVPTVGLLQQRIDDLSKPGEPEPIVLAPSFLSKLMVDFDSFAKQVATSTTASLQESGSEIIVSGSKAAIATTTMLLQELEHRFTNEDVEEFQKDNSNDHDLVKEVPAQQEFHRFLIGARGATMKQIQNETGSQIFFPNTKNAPPEFKPSSDNVVTIVGSAQACDLAQKLIAARVDDCNGQGTTSKESSYMRLLHEIRDKRNSRTSATSSSISSRDSTSKISVKDGDQFDNAQPTSGESSPDNAFANEDIKQTKKKISAIEFHPASAPGSRTASFAQPTPLSATSLPGGVGISLASPPGEVRVSVPAELHGFVVGGRGFVLKEIQSESGARVYLPTTKTAPARARSAGKDVITIIGSRQACETAQKLILARAEDAQNGRKSKEDSAYMNMLHNVREHGNKISNSNSNRHGSVRSEGSLQSLVIPEELDQYNDAVNQWNSRGLPRSISGSRNMQNPGIHTMNVAPQQNGHNISPIHPVDRLDQVPMMFAQGQQHYMNMDGQNPWSDVHTDIMVENHLHLVHNKAQAVNSDMSNTEMKWQSDYQRQSSAEEWTRHPNDELGAADAWSAAIPSNVHPGVHPNNSQHLHHPYMSQEVQPMYTQTNPMHMSLADQLYNQLLEDGTVEAGQVPRIMHMLLEMPIQGLRNAVDDPAFRTRMVIRCVHSIMQMGVMQQ